MSDRPLRVGDVCEIVRSSHGHAGFECTIIYIGTVGVSQPCDCLIDIHDSPSSHPTGLWSKLLADLRLKRPPSAYDGNQAGDWGLCPWAPNRVKTSA